MCENVLHVYMYYLHTEVFFAVTVVDCESGVWGLPFLPCSYHLILYGRCPVVATIVMQDVPMTAYLCVRGLSTHSTKSHGVREQKSSVGGSGVSLS